MVCYFYLIPFVVVFLKYLLKIFSMRTMKKITQMTTETALAILAHLKGNIMLMIKCCNHL